MLFEFLHVNKLLIQTHVDLDVYIQLDTEGMRAVITFKCRLTNKIKRVVQLRYITLPCR